MSDFSLSYDGKDGESIRVDAQLSMVFPEQCTFKVNHPLYADHSVHFAGKDQANGSPLINQLFDLDIVNDVLVSHDELTVTAKGGNWEENVAKIGNVIHSVLMSDDPPISEGVTKSLLPTDEIRTRVQKVLEELINPAIASHGGYVNLLDVANNSVYLEFSGGCHGCGMANVTLKYGVERAIREHVPGIGEVLDRTDHASGRNPYYTSP